MSQPSLKIVTLLGSLRSGSYNAMVARALPKLAPTGVIIEALPSIRDIPLYDADLQQEIFSRKRGSRPQLRPLLSRFVRPMGSLS